MRQGKFLIVLALMVGLQLLAGCSGVREPGRPATGEPAKPAPGTTTGKPGGYYLDDGPGDNPPPDIDSIPDAVPRPEAPLARANRPYIALGRQYTPMTEYQPYHAQGIASWYGKRYHGNKTSSGEIYDMYAMTAAHTTLPIPSYVRVTNPENGRSVVVRVNDRGPFHPDRLIDLSYAAAYKLRLIGKGSGLVDVEAIDRRASAQMATPSEPVQVVVQQQEDGPAVAELFVQMGAFRLKENADELRQRVQQQNLALNAAIQNWYNDGIYRVRAGPYASRADAEHVAQDIQRVLGISTYVITQQETP